MSEVAARRPVSAAAPRERQLDDTLFIACGLSWAAALIHAKAGVDHVDEHVSFAVFFAALTVAQSLWGIAVYQRPHRRLLLGGVALSLATVVVWIASRTSGLPVGPERWNPEPVGPLDLIASADELVLAVIVLLYVAARTASGRSLQGLVRFSTVVAGLGCTLLSMLALMYTGHVH